MSRATADWMALRGIVRPRQDVTTTDSVKRNNGFRCWTCGKFTPVAEGDPYGRAQCPACAGTEGLVRLVREAKDAEGANRQ